MGHFYCSLFPLYSACQDGSNDGIHVNHRYRCTSKTIRGENSPPLLTPQSITVIKFTTPVARLPDRDIILYSHSSLIQSLKFYISTVGKDVQCTPIPVVYSVVGNMLVIWRILCGHEIPKYFVGTRFFKSPSTICCAYLDYAE